MAQETDQEELRKKLESMSPEELKEFQKKQCIFCHIASGKVQSKKIYEDETALAILDINPANPGHVLLFPKEHYMIMPQLPEDALRHIFIITKQLSNTLLRTLDVRGTNIIVANGPAAGQRAQHFMIHIIPRKEGDGLKFVLPSNNYTEEELSSIASNVQKRLNEMIGIKPKDVTAEDILKPKIVEAELEEKKEKSKHKKKSKEEKSNDVDLDAISRVLHGR